MSCALIARRCARGCARCRCRSEGRLALDMAHRAGARQSANHSLFQRNPDAGASNVACHVECLLRRERVRAIEGHVVEHEERGGTIARHPRSNVVRLRAPERRHDARAPPIGAVTAHAILGVHLRAARGVGRERRKRRHALRFDRVAHRHAAARARRGRRRCRACHRRRARSRGHSDCEGSSRSRDPRSGRHAGAATGIADSACTTRRVAIHSRGVPRRDDN